MGSWDETDAQPADRSAWSASLLRPSWPGHTRSAGMRACGRRSARRLPGHRGDGRG